MVIILLLLMHIATGINGTKCNGMEGLCDLRIDQVTFPAAHNAGSDPSVALECLWRNQNYDPLNQFSSISTGSYSTLPVSLWNM